MLLLIEYFFAIPKVYVVAMFLWFAMVNAYMYEYVMKNSLAEGKSRSTEQMGFSIGVDSWASSIHTKYISIKLNTNTQLSYSASSFNMLMS